MEKPNNSAANRRKDGTFGPGNVANPKGRPKGKTMKEFAREFLMNMDDKAKREWLKGLAPDVVWRMAEGNPHNTEDKNVRWVGGTGLLDDLTKPKNEIRENDRD